MATTVIRDDLDGGANKGLKITRTYKRWDAELLQDVDEEEVIYIHQSDLRLRREDIERQEARLSEETTKLNALEAKLTQLWQNAS